MYIAVAQCRSPLPVDDKLSHITEWWLVLAYVELQVVPVGDRMTESAPDPRSVHTESSQEFDIRLVEDELDGLKLTRQVEHMLPDQLWQRRCPFVWLSESVDPLEPPLRYFVGRLAYLQVVLSLTDRRRAAA